MYHSDSQNFPEYYKFQANWDQNYGEFCKKYTYACYVLYIAYSKENNKMKYENHFVLQWLHGISYKRPIKFKHSISHISTSMLGMFLITQSCLYSIMIKLH